MTALYRSILILCFSFLPLNVCPVRAAEPIVDSALMLQEALDDCPGCPDEIMDNQALVDVRYYSVDGLLHEGQIVIDRRLASDIREIFRVILEERFPVVSVIPVSRFGWDDNHSMTANNTSGFNYRQVTGGKQLSNHALGFAIDINPKLNPYVKGDIMLPPGAIYDPSVPGTLTKDHIIVQTFLKLGWEWGGNWTSLKDYQHFEKVPSD